MRRFVIAVALILTTAAYAEDRGSSQTLSQTQELDSSLEEEEFELWAFGYSVPAGNRTFVNTLSEPANNGFNGNGWGSACLNFVGCGR